MNPDTVLDAGDLSFTTLDHLPSRERDRTADHIARERDRFWVHPTDSPRRTRDVLDRDGLTLLLVDDDDIVGYDASLHLTTDARDALYRDRLDPHLPDLPKDTATVYHCVIAPEHRGRGYGLATAYLRQAVLEDGWDTDPAGTYRDLLDGVDGPAVTPDLPDRADPFVTDLQADHAADAVISFSRRYESPSDREQDVLSRAYRIARGYGFDDWETVDGGSTALVSRRREDI